MQMVRPVAVLAFSPSDEIRSSALSPSLVLLSITKDTPPPFRTPSTVTDRTVPLQLAGDDSTILWRLLSNKPQHAESPLHALEAMRKHMPFPASFGCTHSSEYGDAVHVRTEQRPIGNATVWGTDDHPMAMARAAITKDIG